MSRLCVQCRVVFTKTSESELEGHRSRHNPHHNSLRAFKQAADNGCQLCYLLWCQLPRAISRKSDGPRANYSTAIERFRWKHELRLRPLLFSSIKFEISWEAYWCLREHMDSASIAFFFHWGAKWVYAFDNHLEIQKIKESNSVVNLTSDNLGMNTGSDSSLRMAQNWLRTCTSAHQECRNSFDFPRELPSRLVDVHTLGKDHVRLVNTDIQPVSGSYTTLSHRWGKANILRLTRASCEKFQVGIPVSQLPKTFRNAIYVTRYLGINYIWIDSLCIIQDCTTDWARQAQKMGDIYANGICNIAATCAEDSTQGLFMNRDPKLVQPVIFDIQWGTSNLDMPTRTAWYACWPSNYWKAQIECATLNTRAWVAQERMLSPRVLHFSEDQIFWECLHGTACESFPNGHPDFSHEEGLSKQFARDLQQHGVADPEWFIYPPWSSFVNAYSSCNLTKDEDIFPALSGIAQLTRRVLGQDVYLAGLWKNHLLTDLLWRTNASRGEKIRRAHPWRAPTWSWASLKGPVQMVTDDGRVDYFALVEVKRTRIDPVISSSRSMGQIGFGQLVLQGSLLPCQWKYSESAIEVLMALDLEFVIDECITEALGLLDDYQLLVECKLGKTLEVLCLPIKLTVGEWAGGLEGLLLRRCNASKNDFERVGIFRTSRSSKPNWTELRERWVDQWKRHYDLGPTREITLL